MKLQTCARTLVLSAALALAVTGLAGTVHAETNTDDPPAGVEEPVNTAKGKQAPKAGCYMNNVYYKHGSTLTMSDVDGKAVTKRCDNGKWVEAVTTPTGPQMPESTEPTQNKLP